MLPQVLSRDDAIALTERLGGSRYGPTQVAYHPPGQLPRITEIKITEMYPGSLQTTGFLGAHASPGLTLGILHSFKPPCIFGFEPWCWLPDFLDPKILFKLSPLKIQNAQFHVLTRSVEGDVVHRFENHSEEAVGDEKNQRTGATRNSGKAISGSADLNGDFLSRITHDLAPDKVLAEVKDIIQKTSPLNYVDMTGHFTSGGLIGFFEQIYEHATSGTLYTSAGIDTTLKYTLPNGEHGKSLHLDLKLSLPVEGGVSIDTGIGVVDDVGGAIGDAAKGVRNLILGRGSNIPSSELPLYNAFLTSIRHSTTFADLDGVRNSIEAAHFDAHTISGPTRTKLLQAYDKRKSEIRDLGLGARFADGDMVRVRGTNDIGKVLRTDPPGAVAPDIQEWFYSIQEPSGGMVGYRESQLEPL